MKGFGRILTLTQRNVKEIIRDPLSLIFTLAFPLVMEVLFYFIFHSMTAQFEMKYLAPSIVVFSQAFLTLFAGILISVDRSSSFLTRLYVSKARSYEFIFGYALAMLPIAVVQAIAFFLVGGIIDPSIFSWSMLINIALSVVTSLFFIGLGVFFGCVCNEKSVGGVASIVIAGQSVLSGMWFPIDGFNNGFIIFMKCLPFKNSTDLMKNVLNGIVDPFKDFILPLIITLAYAAVAFALAIVFFKKKMREQ